MWAAIIAAIPAVIDLVQKMVNSGAQHDAIEKAVSEVARANGLIPAESSIKIDPQEIADTASMDVQSARKAALSGLTKMGQQGGMDDASRQANLEALQTAQQNQLSSNAGIESRLRQQGQYSPATAALMMQGASADANNQLSRQSLQASADARKRALEALQAGGSLANSVDEAEMARQRFNANMRDAANQYNSNAAMRLSDMRMSGANSMYNARMGGVAGNQHVDDRTTQAMYGAGAQLGSAAKAYETEQQAADARQAREAAKTQSSKDKLVDPWDE